MYGKTTGILSAYVITDGGEEQLIWCKNGDQGTEWKNAKIDLKMTKNFKVSGLIYLSFFSLYAEAVSIVIMQRWRKFL